MTTAEFVLTLQRGDAATTVSVHAAVSFLPRVGEFVVYKSIPYEVRTVDHRLAAERFIHWSVESIVVGAYAEEEATPE